MHTENALLLIVAILLWLLILHLIGRVLALGKRADEATEEHYRQALQARHKELKP